jgi:hypothetical protein
MKSFIHVFHEKSSQNQTILIFFKYHKIVEDFFNGLIIELLTIYLALILQMDGSEVEMRERRVFMS